MSRRRLGLWLALALAGIAAVAGLSRRRPLERPPPRWFPFAPEDPVPAPDALLDLRFLNESVAGEGGFIAVREGDFIHSATGVALRFWGVNGPPPGATGEELRRCARALASRGVNMVRLHGPVFDESGDPDPVKIARALEVVEALKGEGIYTALSIWFPLWLRPGPGTPWLAGYDGRRHPFGALFFNPAFQARYRSWWSGLLLTPSPATGRRLVDEPAVALLEMVNEDSLLFPSFSEARVPDAQLRLLERQFGDWLARRHGSVEAALARWAEATRSRDAPAEGRVALTPLPDVIRARSHRGQETVRFLFEVQHRFYAETYSFLRELGFHGAIGASNWQTASPALLGPLEKLSYLAGDFVDRHGYLECARTGPDAAWALRPGQSFVDRSSLRLEGPSPLGPRNLEHFAMDPHYGGKPSMLSETSWERPNRHRSEGPLFLAAYGALQHGDAIVHFNLDGCGFTPSPRHTVQQPWTLMSPAAMGQFPAAALIFRLGLVATARRLALVELEREALFRLDGTPLPQGAALDETGQRAAFLGDGSPGAGQRIDPLVHLAGRVDVHFVDGPASVHVADLRPLVNRAARTVTSSTGELALDYGAGLLIIDAPRAQGASGALCTAGTVRTRDLSVTSGMEVGHIVAVALDDRPLATSERILLQAMSEEQPAGFRAAPGPGATWRIGELGSPPWMIREISGTVHLQRLDAAALRVTALDAQGRFQARLGDAREIRLLPATLHYLIAR